MKTKSNNNLQLIIIFLIVFFTSTLTQAQQHGQHGQRQGPPPIPDSTQIIQMVNELAKELSLSEFQKTKVTELHFAHFNQAKKMMEKQQSDREQNKKLMDANRKDFETQILTLFSKEQQAKFEVYMKNKRPQQNDGQRPQQPNRKR